MKLKNFITKFLKDDSGAVTVDWVVLTAAIVGLGMVIMTQVGGGIESMSATVVSDLEGRASGYEALGGAGGGAGAGAGAGGGL